MYTAAKSEIKASRPATLDTQTKTSAILAPVTPGLTNFAQYVFGTNVSDNSPLLLTPTTCDTIERTLLELGAAPPSSNPLAFPPRTLATYQSSNGPVVPPASVKKEYVPLGGPGSEYTDDDSSTNDDWDSSSGAKRSKDHVGMALTDNNSGSPGSNAGAGKTARRHTGPRRPRKNVTLSAEEEERRRTRRERNKQAAAKCRQKRVDLTNQLLAETECLESEQLRLQEEIRTFQREKDELEFILETHRLHCGSATVGQLPPLPGTVIAGPVTTTIASIERLPPVTGIMSSIKVEKMSDRAAAVATQAAMVAMQHQAYTVKATTTAHTAVAMQAHTQVALHLPAPSLTMTTTAALATVAATKVPVCRPNSFPTANVRTITMGTTPNGLNLFTFGLESLLDGHTGLTPITGIPSCSVAAVVGPTSSSGDSLLTSGDSVTSVIAL